MASVWENLPGLGRPLEPRRRYLAVVARERPDLLPRVNRLFHPDGNVEAILDRRHGERRRHRGSPAEERRRADRRQAAPEADESAGPVVLAQASTTALPERLIRWMTAGQDALAGLERVMDDLAALERECATLRASVEQLRAENEALRARDAASSRQVAGLAEDIAGPLADIVQRLRTR